MLWTIGDFDWSLNILRDWISVIPISILDYPPFIPRIPKRGCGGRGNTIVNDRMVVQSTAPLGMIRLQRSGGDAAKGADQNSLLSLAKSLYGSVSIFGSKFSFIKLIGHTCRKSFHS